MKPRWEALKQKKPSETYGLYVVDYVSLDRANILLNEYQRHHSVRILHFVPENQVGYKIRFYW